MSKEFKPLTQEEWDSLIELWLEQRGVLGEPYLGAPSYIFPKSFDDRVEALDFLIGILINEYGYTEETLREKRCFDRIVNGCVNLKLKNKENLTLWITGVSKALRATLNGIYGTKELKEYKLEKKGAVLTQRKDGKIVKRSADELGPDTPMIDRRTLTGPKATSVIDDSIDIFDGALDEADNE